MSNLNFYNMRRLLSFLCLFVIGWGSAWADEATVTFTSGSNMPERTYAGNGIDASNSSTVDPITMLIHNGYATDGTTVNYVSYNSNNSLRFRVGTYFTISCEDGYKITGIQYNTLNNNRNFTASSGSISGYSAGGSGGYDYTWSTTEDNVNSVTFTNNSTGNLDVTSIIVTYEELPAAPELVPTWMSFMGGGAINDGIAVGGTAIGTFYVRYSGGIVSVSDEGLTASNFEVTSTNGTAAIRDLTTSNNRIRLNVIPERAGEVTVTVKFLGSTNYEPSEWTFTITTAGTEIRIGGLGGNDDSRYIDDAAWNHIVTLRPIGDETNLTISSKDNFNVYSNDTTGVAVFSVSNLTDNNTRLPIKITPLKVGKMTVNVDFLGDAQYYPCSGSFEIEVNKHTTKLEFSSNSLEVNYTSDGATVNGVPALTRYMDGETNNVTYSVVYTSSDEHVATVDNNGQVTMHNSGTTVITAKVVVTKTINVNGQDVTIEAYNESYDTYTLTVKGTQNVDYKLVWFSQLNPLTGSTQGGAYRGSYWTQKNVMYWNNSSLNTATDLENLINQETIYKYGGTGGDLIVSAAVFTDLDWVSNYPFIHKLKGDPDNPNVGPGERDYHYVTVEENGVGSGGFNWRYSNVADHIPAEAQGSGSSASTMWMSNIKYSISDPNLLDAFSKGEVQISPNQGNYKGYQIIPYPPLDENGNISTDSVTIYAYIPGNGNINPVTIEHSIKIEKGSYSLTMDPDEGWVTKGEWIIPYVNIPGIKLKDINRITAWVVDSIGNNVAEVAFEKKVGDEYVLYEKNETNTEWMDVQLNKDGTGIDVVNMIYPKIIGLNQGTAYVYVKVESPYYEDQQCRYIVNVLEDSDKPAFHWVCNDDGSKTHKWNIGWDKGTNAARGDVYFGEDDGVMRKITMVQGDYIYMPGIVGTANGNDEYSVAYTYHYMYGIKNGKVEMNREPYFWREGVPNYFFTESSTDFRTPLIPTNGQSTDQVALIYKEKYSNESPRLDTLMIYANHPGTTYLWAQDPQTHLCCTPIEIEVIAKNIVDNAKRRYMNTMSYPYTWDFEHMDMEDYETDAKLSVEGNAKGNLGAYWEPHREKPGDYYQANGLFNADHDDKNSNGNYRQRWFKDITANGEYLPHFYGLMINLAGLDYWDQKYNRFSIQKEGKHIKFSGGPIYLQLPGFGINAENIDQNDGTRNNDNKISKLHNAVNTAKYSATDDSYQTVNTNFNATSSVNTSYTGLNDYNNRHVRFVIKARGGRTTTSNNADPGKNGSSQFHIGGKSMINAALSKNAIEWTNATHSGYDQYNLPYKDSKGKDLEPEIYVFDLDPYDPEFQDHIYIMFNNDVEVYWMGISTEPRDMRSDYDMFTYSYPKDIDLDKTNVMMKIATAQGVTAKTEVDGQTTTTGVGKVGSGGDANTVQFKAYYASRFNRLTETLTMSRFKPVYGENRIPANEGVIIYPSVGAAPSSKNGWEFTNTRVSEAFGHKDVGGLEQIKPAPRNVVTFVGWQEYTWYENKPVINEETGETIRVERIEHKSQIPLYDTKRVQYQYQYLPTYFIANAENTYAYHEDHGSVGDSNYEFGYQRGYVTSLNAGFDPQVGNIELNGEVLPGNTSANLLRGSTYTTFIKENYFDNQNSRWINLGLTNEYIARTLRVDDHDGMYKALDGVLGAAGGDINMYYELIGPDFVRFYRANQDQNMKNRRAYLTLTWEEYNVNTDGKKGLTYAEIAEQDPENFPPSWFGWNGTDKSLWESDETNATDIGAGSANPPVFGISAHYYPVRFVIDEDNNTDEETLVSEDGGFPDGINEVKTNEGKMDIYNLNGVRVNSLRKGIYIVNGKKVIVK